MGSGVASILFLDRDGVINVNYGYVHKQKNFDFIEGIFDLVRLAKSNDFLVFVITNQSGIARGYYSIEDFNVLSAWMMMQFVNHGAAIDKIYFSPYHPKEGKGEFLKDDFSRKPNPGMILDACTDYDIDLAQSILVGDKMTDIEAGQRAGVGRNILLTDRASSGDHECVSRLKDALGYFGSVVSG